MRKRRQLLDPSFKTTYTLLAQGFDEQTNRVAPELLTSLRIRVLSLKPLPPLGLQALPGLACARCVCERPALLVLI